MTEGRAREFQENATYMDFIKRGEAGFSLKHNTCNILFADSLNRSVELVISSPTSASHHQLDQPPSGHIKNLDTTPAPHNATCDNPLNT